MKATIKQRNKHNHLREFVLNSRHPDPRRVWKVGSGAHLLPSLLGDPRDPQDPQDPRDPRDPGENSEASIFSNLSVAFDHFARKAFTKNVPEPQKVAPRVGETPC